MDENRFALSRHPKIQYWFWDKTINEDAIRAQLDLLCAASDFNTVFLTEREGLDFYDRSLLPLFTAAVRYAHEKGLKIYLQLWPQGFNNPPTPAVAVTDAAALVTEAEGSAEKGSVSLRFICGTVRNPRINRPLACRLLRAYAFRKEGEGLYAAGTLTDVTEMATLTHHDPTDATVSFTGLPDGVTVYAMVAHYYDQADLYSPRSDEDLLRAMEDYGAAGFDGFVLDEMRGLSILPPWSGVTFRERLYGHHLARALAEQTGEEPETLLFAMRYAPVGEEGKRARAINLYFDTIRHAATRAERLVADYNRRVFGKEAFLGLHTTFHNGLDMDEIWATGCNWWEVPRIYAQTDEDITFPVRMGLACQAKESLIYDMYYHREKERFFAKAMRDAAFGCRIHYHAMNDKGIWGTDTGTEAFLHLLRPYEEKISLLNAFDPQGLPEMELLVVFGFPATCNWYPHESARSSHDVNKGLNILPRVDALWRGGYLCALAPSDALDDGRIRLGEDGRFDYCGHRFEKLLYLYPAYAKKTTLAALADMRARGGRMAVIGEGKWDFDGDPLPSHLFDGITLGEEEDIVTRLALRKNPIPCGCRLEDGSVVMSDALSLETHTPRAVSLMLDGHLFETAYEGVFAIRTDGKGEVARLVCGACTRIKRDGKVIFASDTPRDVILS